VNHDLRRLRLPLDKHESDLLLVSDGFGEGARYVMIEIPRAESASWTWLDWDEQYDALAREWLVSLPWAVPAIPASKEPHR